jgi:hypothetical protein
LPRFSLKRGEEDLDRRALDRSWVRDSHLSRLDVYLIPVMKKQRWTVDELIQYCSETRKLQFLDARLIRRWLATAERRGLVIEVERSVDGEVATYWEITDRGYGRHFGVLAKFVGATGTITFLFGAIAGVFSGGIQTVATWALVIGLGLVAGFVVGAALGDRSPFVKRRIVTRESRIQQVLDAADRPATPTQ